MTSTIGRLADRMLARLVPQEKAEAATCVLGKTIWRFCYCSRGLKIGQPCYYTRIDGDYRCLCYGCQAVMGAC